jgi:predicted chitinase
MKFFYGGGFVQLTWYENYAERSKEVGQDFSA